MKSIRNNVFETNSSSTHSLTFVSKGSKIKYKLSESGYLEAGFDDYILESTYECYTTVEEKLRFVLTLLASFYYEYKVKSHYQKTGKFGYVGYTTKKELQSLDDYKEILRLVQEKIPNCKGLRFRKHSFDENGVVLGSMDTHHLQDCHSLHEYLKKNNVTLEQLLFSPRIAIQMNR